MFSTVDNNKINYVAIQNSDEKKQDLIKAIPDELVLEVFSHLNLATLSTICCVSKQWKQLASQPIVWKIAMYNEIAFGNSKWAKYFGKDVIKNEDTKEEFSSLPFDAFIEDCKKFKNLFPGKSAKDSLMLVRLPKTLNGQLTLKNLGELAKKYFPTSDAGYDKGYLWPPVLAEGGDKTIDQSQWVLMTNDLLPDSRSKNYAEHQAMIANLAQQKLIGYEIPEIIESTACILAQHFKTNSVGDSENPFYNGCTYTVCKDNIQGSHTLVGGLKNSGLRIYYHNQPGFATGVAALRKP
ncbi:hypothetical protein PNK_0559 [Candidatus Protochlamydia naegleriophila]|uniref:F-box domain-containing protein n=1 Tax=Candidatus Protochlamydia naegleriophila TaxID=389348 RepID=A0A0U5K261_9BACT|nr:F-box protein [Candidatus Protochlamydia naegleriophila]CUI16187.1 hypothetical protein PNK_0559 [Candidatus Protochlamydia naegleriophila]